MKINTKTILGVSILAIIGYFLLNKPQATNQPKPSEAPKNKFKAFIDDLFKKANANLIKSESDADNLLAQYNITKSELQIYFNENPKEQDKVMGKIMEALSKTTIKATPMPTVKPRPIPEVDLINSTKRFTFNQSYTAKNSYNQEQIFNQNQVVSGIVDEINGIVTIKSGGRPPTSEDLKNNIYVFRVPINVLTPSAGQIPRFLGT